MSVAMPFAGTPVLHALEKRGLHHGRAFGICFAGLAPAQSVQIFCMALLAAVFGDEKREAGEWLVAEVIEPIAWIFEFTRWNAFGRLLHFSPSAE